MRAFVLLVLVGLCQSRPPVQKGPRGKPAQNETAAEWDVGVEYNRYLQEVVQVLESDPEFRKKLENADVDAIRDGTIAHELEFVQHGVRTKLDEIKRRELERLRHLAVKQNEISQGIDRKHMKIPQHLEFQNPRFEIDDLKKLIKSTTQDLEEADRKRREEFKRYEMEKKFEHEERLKHIDDEQKRKEEQERMEKAEAKHREHGKVHHPMTHDQLEEVWEQQDGMRAEDWNPKTFFAIHDLNGDNFWDEDEVRVLFRKELDKVYDPNEPEDDMREREEEMERMREHVFKESDTNKDHLISFEEFMAETKRDEFENDPGWETMDMGEDDFNDEEFRAYQAQREREIQGMINQGRVPPGYPYFGDLPPGAVPYQIPPNHPAGVNGQGLGIGGGSIPGQPAFQQPQMGQPQMGHPQQMGQHPQMGQPQMGHPQMGQPQMGQPQMGQPQMGQHPQMGQPQMGQPQMGQPQMGQPQRGQPQMGQPQAGQQMGQGQFQAQQPRFVPQQPQVGQPQAGQPQMGQPQAVQPPSGQNAQPNQDFHQDLRAPDAKQP